MNLFFSDSSLVECVCSIVYYDHKKLLNRLHWWQELRNYKNIILRIAQTITKASEQEIYSFGYYIVVFYLYTDNKVLFDCFLVYCS